MQDRIDLSEQELRRAGQRGMGLLAATLLLLFAGRAPAAGSAALSRVVGRIVVLHQASVSLLARGAVVHALIATEWVFVTAPTDIAVNNEPGKCGAMVNLNTPAPPPSSGIASVVDQPPSGFFPVGTTTVTRTVTLTDGTSSPFPFKVTVKDTEPPTITTPPVTANTDVGQCTASHVILGTLTINDNCGLAQVTNDAPAAFLLGQTMVTWTVTDTSGNQQTATQLVTVTDAEKPKLTAPPALVAYTDALTCSASPTTLGTPTASDNCSLMSVVNDAPAVFPLGDTTVTWTATDAAGNWQTATQKVTVKDGTPPVFSNSSPSGTMAWATCTASGAGALVSFSMPTASDNCSTPTVSCDHASGSYFPAGHSTVTATVTDAAGNVATYPFTVSVLYNWSGVLQPMNADGSSVFKAGSTVPVKFALTGASACVSTLAATLSYAKVSNGVPGAVNEADSTSAATTGNLFRYTGGQYLFNWSTKGLTAGTYELRIDLGDGVTHAVRLGLK